MKQLFFLITIVAISYLLFNYSSRKSDSNAAQITEIQFELAPTEQSINVVTFQDASGSISANGVELFHSSVFLPYYNDVYRDIQLSYGIIDSATSKKLITIELPAMRIKKPIMPEVQNVVFGSGNGLKTKYAIAYQKYQEDSAVFFSHRKQMFQSFCDQVDSAIIPYRKHLCGHTDLVTALPIADKVFNYSFAGPSANYLLLNSDGQDSYKRKTGKLKNKAEVILINANGNAVTSIDNVITKSLQSTEQAIEFTLSNHN